MEVKTSVKCRLDSLTLATWKHQFLDSYNRDAPADEKQMWPILHQTLCSSLALVYAHRKQGKTLAFPSSIVAPSDKFEFGAKTLEPLILSPAASCPLLPERLKRDWMRRILETPEREKYTPLKCFELAYQLLCAAAATDPGPTHPGELTAWIGHLDRATISEYAPLDAALILPVNKVIVKQ